MQSNQLEWGQWVAMISHVTAAARRINIWANPSLLLTKKNIFWVSTVNGQWSMSNSLGTQKLLGLCKRAFKTISIPKTIPVREIVFVLKQDMTSVLLLVSVETMLMTSEL